MIRRVYAMLCGAAAFGSVGAFAQPTPKAMVVAPNQVHGSIITNRGNIYTVRSNDLSILYQDGESTAPNVIFLMSTPIGFETVVSLYGFQPLAPVFNSDEVLASTIVSGLSPENVSELIVFDSFGNDRAVVSGQTGSLPSDYLNAQFNNAGAVRWDGTTGSYSITSAVFERDSPSANSPASQILYRTDGTSDRLDYLDGVLSNRLPEQIAALAASSSIRRTENFPGLEIGNPSFPPGGSTGLFNVAEVFHSEDVTDAPAVDQVAAIANAVTLVGGAIGQVSVREVSSGEGHVAGRSVPLDENLNLSLLSVGSNIDVLALTSRAVIPASAQEAALADFDMDGMVDIDDALFLADCYGGAQGSCTDADLNGDGRVDHRDFSLFVRCYGQTVTRSTRADVAVNPNIGLQLIATQVDLDFPGASGALYIRANSFEGNGRGVAAVVLERFNDGAPATRDVLMFDSRGSRIIYNEGDVVDGLKTTSLRVDNNGVFRSVTNVNPAGQFGVVAGIEDGRTAIFRYQGVGTSACFLQPMQIAGYILQAGNTLECFDANGDGLLDVADIVAVQNQPPVRGVR